MIPSQCEQQDEKSAEMAMLPKGCMDVFGHTNVPQDVLDQLAVPHIGHMVVRTVHRVQTP